ncbi:MAG: ATP-binding cassette domain-containing protein [bacterium]|nr:ATP-binding cassette domain-containing protein [bacterium]
MIEVKNLSKRYGITQAVRDVSFEVKRGEVLGFLGPNGAGKTTTMKIITCYIPPTDGTVSVAGFDILENPLDVRKRIGYLPESTPLYTDLMVEEYLYFVAQMRQIPISQRQQRIKKIIETCSLKEVLKKDIGQLSKGFKQRVGLAQAMIHDPDILILDEPTSGLDPNQIIEIRQLIKKLGKEKTIILSTHILPEVSATCDRVIIINEGQLVASGTPSELQEQAAGDTILYSSIKALKKDIESVLPTLDFVKEFRLIDTQDSFLRYKIITQKTESDPGEQLFSAAVKNNWILSEIHKENLSMEDIFLKLTS